jgi:hypothetical protein
LLSTVHWVATREDAHNAEEATILVHAWNERKKIFLPAQIELAWQVLTQKGWIKLDNVAGS